MAKSNQDSALSNNTNVFTKGLNKDSDPAFIGEGMWTHARNAVNNTIEGDVGTLSNETSNFKCPAGLNPGETMVPAVGPKYIIGAIYLYSDKWVIFTVGYNALNIPIMSEIGLLEEERCIYRPIVQDACLNFNVNNLLTGSARLNKDCSWQVYWADGLNPDRTLNVGDPQTWPADTFSWQLNGVSNPSAYPNLVNYYTDGTTQILWPNVPWQQINCTPLPCVTCDDTNILDCDKTRLARIMQTPCLKLNVGDNGGNLSNGSYYAYIAYTINQERVTDYFAPSNVQPIFSPNDLSGSLLLTVDADTVNFDEFELVLVSYVNQALVAKRFGYYNTQVTDIFIDQIRLDLRDVNSALLPLVSPIYEKSDQMTDVGDFLLRIGPTSKFEFNYQPLANLINTEWVSVEYPANYYVKGGSNASYLRDEIYGFFIRFIYNTGEKTVSYHIPGRPAVTYPPVGLAENAGYTDPLNSLPADNLLFETINTATITSIAQSTLPDGGKVVAKGAMGYWQSTELYPNNKPEVWNSSSQCWTGTTNPLYDLCGLPIRHHKFPENITQGSSITNHFTNPPSAQQVGGQSIRLLGVQFNNIRYPKDNDGVDIPGVVGYEILRSSREGNRTIIAKGMINNFKDFFIKGDQSNNRKGLYANHPYNTIFPNGNNPTNTNAHDYQFNDPYVYVSDNNNNKLNQNVPKNITSFHSPETNFRSPYLEARELKLYGHLKGVATERFIEPAAHPKFKLLRNEILFVVLIGGLADALLKVIGKRTKNYPKGNFTMPYVSNIIQGAQAGITNPAAAGKNPASFGVPAGYNGANTQFNTSILAYTNTGAAITDFFTAGDTLNNIYLKHAGQEGVINPSLHWTRRFGANSSTSTYSNEESGFGMMPNWAQIIGGSIMFSYYFFEGAQTTLRIIQAFTRNRQYALQLISHGFYDTFVAPVNSDGSGQTARRFIIEDSLYVRDEIQDFPEYQNTNTGAFDRYLINNIDRGSFVGLRTNRNNGTTDGPRLLLNYNGTSVVSGIDESLLTVGTAQNAGYDINFSNKKTNTLNTTIASHYAAIKVRIQNLFGQLENIKQIIITPCEQTFDYNTLSFSSIPCGDSKLKLIPASPVFFGGDTFITRYTEKNTFFLFYNWLYNVNDGFEYNYFMNQMIPEARFWANSEEYDFSDFTNPSNLLQALQNNGLGAFGTGTLPSNFYHLDNTNYNYNNDNMNLNVISNGLMGVKNAYFYLATSGVRDFFVESDILLDFRQQGTFDYQKSYLPYRFTDLEDLFRMDPDRITQGNYYIYDFSLSASTLPNRLATSGVLQRLIYDPNISSLCYTYHPNRIIYSLPGINSEVNQWYIFLINNKKDFKSNLNTVKAFARTGMFITFKNDSPVFYQGVDNLKLSESGTKVIVGDGGLFQQQVQSTSAADRSYEYGSSQNRFSVISTPVGLYYISQNQGKVFTYSESLQEISDAGLKWWFSLFLPYKLTEDFPDYPNIDNPVIGIGCTGVYDNINQVLYFSKKDYKLKEEYKGKVRYNSDKDYFSLLDVNGNASPTIYTLKTLLTAGIVEDASWTVSYDPKSKYWVSFHDWHPDLVLPTKNYFLTTKNNSIWKHNYLCSGFQSYCNFYGTNYPFEVEIAISTGTTVTTVKSVEYYLECYRRSEFNCIDQFHILDFNFDTAVLFNTEQVTGYLNLNLFPKNNVTLSLDYPKINNSNLASYDILFSNEENKYRFNQFWDITKDRGEFPIASNYPPTGPVIPGTTILNGNYSENYIWLTSSNGYDKVLNPNNLNYGKSETQRKKLRNNLNFMYLRKEISGDVNMIVKVTDTKNQISHR